MALAAADEKAEQIFVRRIVPLFAEKCLACHRQDEARQREIAKANDATWSVKWSNREYKTEELWAYQPVRKPAPPAIQGNLMDAFVTKKLHAGIAPLPTCASRC